MIRVKPIIDSILYKDENNGVLPMFDAFVEMMKTKKPVGAVRLKELQSMRG